MIPRLPRIFTISPAAPFLEVLAQNILDGFPLDGTATATRFTDWTVLLPTRRAAREFTEIFIHFAGRKTILLPRVKAIGDLDEELEFDGTDSAGVLQPISPNGLLFLLQVLISEWAKQNPGLALAQSIDVSASQRLGLARSLVALLHQLDTQEIDLNNLPLAYDLELSEHRQAILGLLALVHRVLPQKLDELHRTTFAAWRNTMLRREASRVQQQRIKMPIIAAGSTGTIPATRALLRAISQHPMGAVILPGLDQDIDDESWRSLPPEHAQFAMKHLIEEFGILRSDAKTLGPLLSPKTFLLGELLRPTQTAEIWSKALPASAAILNAATHGINLVEARDHHIEARAIALILRHALEASDRATAALVTPNRDLAARVRNELQRWNISIDDSAGQPASRFGLAAACHALIQTVLHNFEATVLFDFLRHSEISMGHHGAEKAAVLKNIEIAILRNTNVADGLGGLGHAFSRAREAKDKGERSHPLLASLDENQWAKMENFIHQVQEILAPLQDKEILPFGQCLSKFIAVLKQLSPDVDETTPENLAFAEILDQLQADAEFSPDLDNHSFLINLAYILETAPFRSKANTNPRLSILGTLEARLLPSDVVILGGLNEGVWPTEPDAGPWLNRPMRDILKLAQPEREIGQSAHDFAQGLGYPHVYLTWSKRVSGTPKNPSRWILRLKNLFRAAGLPETQCEDDTWCKFAEAMDDATMVPKGKPRPKPAVTARPTRFSVTEVENLLRDPYGVYAKRVLNLQPLEGLTNKSDPRLRGILFHAAITEWTRQQPKRPSPDDLELLLEAGRKAMLPLMGDPEVSAFWMPAFSRMAIWLAENDRQLRQGVIRVVSEVAGKITFDVSSVPHLLTARADRIDFMSDNKVRIVDYKTGEVPTSEQVNAGFSPQLLLEGAILKAGGFKDLPQRDIGELLYIKLSSGRISGELRQISFKHSSIDDKVQQQLQHLKTHLANYQSIETAYMPRRAPKTEMQVMAYDHLSRFAEWILAEE